ncbi:Plasma serine protease inhibitor [Gossypium arboreum]|uniref:Plasma serine protease inhibitor n=1 Tax=Gossypium arboreum TaxID=29729 RepID=A0A0B0N6E4_GOSAR|nr:Plasma serine protease inhibitor [Gossypium arboreum]
MALTLLNLTWGKSSKPSIVEGLICNLNKSSRASLQHK